MIGLVEGLGPKFENLGEKQRSMPGMADNQRFSDQGSGLSLGFRV